MKQVTITSKAVCLSHFEPADNRSARARAARFLTDESGSLGWFTLVLFMLMWVFGGIGVDLMRYEYNRTALQQTTDRAALAAASLTQQLGSKAVVNDYFAKENMLDNLVDVTVTPDPDSETQIVVGDYKRVEITSQTVMPTFFMQLIGTEALTAPASGTAEQSISNVEIALVLDVSRSMILTDSGNSNPKKLKNVKTAAQQFVTDIKSRDSQNRASISIVPYNGQVNLNDDLFKYFNVTYKPSAALVPNSRDSQCVDLPSSVYSQTGIPVNTELPATGYVDPYSSTAAPNELNRWCPPKSENQIMLPSTSEAALKERIENLTAIGATSINAGIKWGLTMLDPSMRGFYADKIQQGIMGQELTERPYDYDQGDAMKVIVLMTDGSHFAEYRLRDAYRTGTSPIYYQSGTKTYSIYHASKSGNDKYYTPSTGEWRSGPTKTQQSCSKNKCTTTAVVATDAVRWTWEQVWENMTVAYVAQNFYVNAGIADYDKKLYTSQLNSMRATTDIGDMDDQLQDICTLAKSKGVIIYGIAFEAPSEGQNQISKCAQSIIEKQAGTNAKSSAYYFESDGSKIGTDFQTIASNISQLRLTQ